MKAASHVRRRTLGRRDEGRRPPHSGGAARSSILLMSPMDRGERKDNGEIDTMATLPRLVAIESKVAAETGVAFFNTFEAMGGEGTMARGTPPSLGWWARISFIPCPPARKSWGSSCTTPSGWI